MPTKGPGRKARTTKQRKTKRYQKLREDLQMTGILPTTPEGAVKIENVEPQSQGEQLLAGIVVRAARESWSTPLEKRGIVVDELVKVVENEESRAFDKIMAANALGKLDQIQYERDNPEQAGKAKGGVSVENKNEVTVVDLGELFRRVHEQRKGVTNGTSNSEDARRIGEGIQKTGEICREQLPDAAENGERLANDNG